MLLGPYRCSLKAADFLKKRKSLQKEGNISSNIFSSIITIHIHSWESVRRSHRAGQGSELSHLSEPGVEVGVVVGIGVGVEAGVGVRVGVAVNVGVGVGEDVGVEV